MADGASEDNHRKGLRLMQKCSKVEAAKVSNQRVDHLKSSVLMLRNLLSSFSEYFHIIFKVPLFNPFRSIFSVYMNSSLELQESRKFW